jgi:Nucleotidyltransferase domain
MTTATWATVGGRALWNGQSLEHWSDVLASELVPLFNPVEVWLFGSVATNDDTGDSDLDVLVVLDHYEPGNAIAMKRQAILGVSAPVPFDVAFSDPDRMEQRGRLAGTIERAVHLDGILKHRRG